MTDLRHYDVIVSPSITEKSTMVSEYNQVVFQVALSQRSGGVGTHVGGGVERAPQVVDADGVALAVGNLLQLPWRQLITLAK